MRLNDPNGLSRLVILLFPILLLLPGLAVAENTQPNTSPQVQAEPLVTSQPNVQWGQVNSAWPYYGAAVEVVLRSAPRCELGLEIAWINQYQRQLYIEKQRRPSINGRRRNNTERYNWVEVVLKCWEYPIVGSRPVLFDEHNHSSPNNDTYFQNIIDHNTSNLEGLGFSLKSPRGCGFPGESRCQFERTVDSANQ